MTKVEIAEGMYKDGLATLDEATMLLVLEGWNASEAKEHLSKQKITSNEHTSGTKREKQTRRARKTAR